MIATAMMGAICLCQLPHDASQVKASPLDAFRANRDAIRVDLDYRYVAGRTDASAIPADRFSRPPAIPDPPKKSFAGRWSFDGRCEQGIRDFDLPDGTGAKGTRARREQLLDGEVRAKLDTGPGLAAYLAVVETRESAIDRAGPFQWWDQFPFPELLAQRFPGTTPAHTRGTRAGRPVEYEVYRKELGGKGWFQVEVAYDPSVGFLPRYARSLELSPDDGRGWVKEMYLLEAAPCAAGGFVPTSWYDTFYHIDNFTSHYSDYQAGADLAPTSGKVFAGHFAATRVADRTRPVRLETVPENFAVSTTTGVAGFGKPPADFGIDRVRRIAGDIAKSSTNPVLPNIDEEELNRYSTPAESGSWTRFLPHALIALVASAAGALAFRRRMSGRWLILAFGVACQGCAASHSDGSTQPTTPVLKAAFTRTRMVYEPGSTLVDATLVVKNEGGEALKLFKADGGCSCRQIDQSALPTTLGPGASLALKVGLSDKRQYEPQNISFTFQTDQGTLVAPAVLYALPSLSMSPDVLTANAVGTTQDLAFEVVVREVYHGDTRPGGHDMLPPEGVAVAATGEVRSGKVRGAPEFHYRDTPYRIEVLDRSLGLHKTMLYVRGREAKREVQASVVWNRIPFLSSAPDRVILGARPVRVFVRCPDPDVEATKILAVPEGVVAEVTSSKEVTVRVADDAPSLIQGFVEVLTSAQEEPVLKIPVVRYSAATQAD